MRDIPSPTFCYELISAIVAIISAQQTSKNLSDCLGSISFISMCYGIDLILG